MVHMITITLYPGPFTSLFTSPYVSARVNVVNEGRDDTRKVNRWWRKWSGTAEPDTERPTEAGNRRGSLTFILLSLRLFSFLSASSPVPLLSLQSARRAWRGPDSRPKAERKGPDTTEGPRTLPARRGRETTNEERRSPDVAWRKGIWKRKSLVTAGKNWTMMVIVVSAVGRVVPWLLPSPCHFPSSSLTRVASVRLGSLFIPLVTSALRSSSSSLPRLLLPTVSPHSIRHSLRGVSTTEETRWWG